MSYNNSPGGGKLYSTPFLNVDLGTTFTRAGKAYKLSITNNYKFRIQVTTAKQEADGTKKWDFLHNSTTLVLSWNDMYRLYMAATEMAKIYVARTSGKIDLTDPKNKVYTTKSIRLPLVSGATGAIYGEIIVGVCQDPNSRGEETFAFSYSTTNKSNETTRDSIIFDRAQGNDGIFEYNDGPTKIHESFNTNLGFTDFVTQLESCVKFGKIIFGLYSAGSRSSSKGGYSSGGSQGGDAGSSSSPYEDDSNSIF